MHLPQAPCPGTPGGPYLQDVVARVVTVVADPDLRAHVPAAEGTGAELQAADLQQHVGHGGEAVPLEAQLLEPVEPADGNTAQFRMGPATPGQARGWGQPSEGDVDLPAAAWE